MTSADILQFLMLLLAVTGVAVAVRGIMRSLEAERDWKKASAELSDTNAYLIADLLEEKRLLLATESAQPFDRFYLVNAIDELVRLLRDRHELSPRSAAHLAAVLHGPSVAGRQAYADKLARAALQARSPAIAGHGGGDRPPFLRPADDWRSPGAKVHPPKPRE